MKVCFCLSVLLILGTAVNAQTSLSQMTTNQDIATQIYDLSKREGTYDEQISLLWLLVNRASAGDSGAHRLGRPISQRLKEENPLDPRANFAFGYFRIAEAFDTLNVFTRKVRIDEGRKNLYESLTMGARDGDFLMDAGMALIALPRDVNLYRTALNTLFQAKRSLGEAFEALPAQQVAHWHVSVARGFELMGLDELARDSYSAAAKLAPDSEAGRKAIVWLRSNGI
jgi:hypothetical protein